MPASSARSPTYVRPASIAEVLELHSLAPISLITLAPELPGNLDVIPALRAAGFRVQIGHTLGTYDDGVAALEQGAAGFTHLFNAMSGMHHRAPGIVGAALAHARYAEIIPDLLHVHPGAIACARCARSPASSASPTRRPLPACPTATISWVPTA